MEPKIARFIGETAWHKDWKLAFPKDFREVCTTNSLTGELHRADVYTHCGTTIEFQNSPITAAELLSREAYYSNLIWVLNGKKFGGFRILKHLPDVDDPNLADYEFRHTDHLSMIRKIEVMAGIIKPQVLNFHHPEIRHVAFSSSYYSFCWKKPHRVWLKSKAPIFVDLGGHFLYQIKLRRQLSGDYPYLHMISKKSFIQQFLPA
ncbi:competence protein CoiA family protein [Pedobacter sp. PWIIR3]